MSQLPDSIEIVSTNSAAFHYGVKCGEIGFTCTPPFGPEEEAAWREGYEIGKQCAKNAGNSAEAEYTAGHEAGRDGKLVSDCPPNQRHSFAPWLQGYHEGTKERFATRAAKKVLLGRKLFEFTSFEDWNKHGYLKWRESKQDWDNCICIDQRGQICTGATQFRQAETEGAYPIEVFLARPEQ